MENKQLYKIHVTGRVQGVGFRWKASLEAESLGITGFVRNMSDGSVYIEAEGFREGLNLFVEWCRGGPGSVESVTADSFPAAGYSEFTIRH
jgi:acylphosphatase